VRNKLHLSNPRLRTPGRLFATSGWPIIKTEEFKLGQPSVRRVFSNAALPMRQ